jgi:hypothetical protein
MIFLFCSDVGRRPTRFLLRLSIVTAVCCQIDASASGLSLLQSPIKCGASAYDREASTMGSPRPTRGCRDVTNKGNTTDTGLSSGLGTRHSLNGFNPFRSYIGPRPTMIFEVSDVGRLPTRFLLRLFARCRSLSDAFPHVVRTLTNR